MYRYEKIGNGYITVHKYIFNEELLVHQFHASTEIINNHIYYPYCRIHLIQSSSMKQYKNISTFQKYYCLSNALYRYENILLNSFPHFCLPLFHFIIINKTRVKMQIFSISSFIFSCHRRHQMPVVLQLSEHIASH